MPSDRRQRPVGQGWRLHQDPVLRADVAPASTIAITPALRTSSPAASRSRVAAMRPGCRRFNWWQGLRSPVTSTTARAPSRSLVPLASPSRSTPREVTFSPIRPGVIAKPAAINSSSNSPWIRCTWRRLGCVGSRATRDRCCTVRPRWASPSTPSPASRWMTGWLGLLMLWSGPLLTATTMPLIVLPVLGWIPPAAMPRAASVGRDQPNLYSSWRAFMKPCSAIRFQAISSLRLLRKDCTTFFVMASPVSRISAMTWPQASP